MPGGSGAASLLIGPGPGEVVRMRGAGPGRGIEHRPESGARSGPGPGDSVKLAAASSSAGTREQARSMRRLPVRQSGGEREEEGHGDRDLEKREQKICNDKREMKTPMEEGECI